MIRYISAFMAGVCLIAAVAGCDLKKSKGPEDILSAVKKRGSLRIGVKADAPPFGWKDEYGNYGFDIDMANAIADELGIEKIEFVTVTSADRIEKVVAGDIDMALASMTITRGREKEVDFSIPYFQDGQALLVRADSEIASYEELAGKAVGTAKGATSIANIRQVQPDCEVKEFDGYQKALDALLAKEVDAVTSDMLILMGLKLSSANPDSVRLAGERFSTEPYGVAVAENQSRFRDAINDAIQRLWESGRWQQIFENWFGQNAKYSTEVPFVIVPYPK